MPILKYVIPYKNTSSLSPKTSKSYISNKSYHFCNIPIRIRAQHAKIKLRTLITTIGTVKKNLKKNSNFRQILHISRGLWTPLNTLVVTSFNQERVFDFENWLFTFFLKIQLEQWRTKKTSFLPVHFHQPMSIGY